MLMERATGLFGCAGNERCTIDGWVTTSQGA